MIKQKNLRIAIVADVINEHSGARAPIRLATFLNKESADITFFASSHLLDLNLKEELQKKGIKVFVLPSSRIPFLGRFFGALKLFLYLKEGDFDIISLQSSSLLYAIIRLTGVRIVKTYYGTQLDLGLNMRDGIISLIPSWILKFVIILREKLFFLISNKVIAISKYLVTEAKQIYNKNIEYVYLGVDLFKVAEVAENKNNKKIICLSVSRIVPYKGFHFLIKAFLTVNKKVPDLRLYIVGTAPFPKYLSFLDKIKNENVKILLDVGDEHLGSLYKSCDIYATFDQWVPWSLAPLEASLYSKPLVGIKAGAMGEIITHNKNGLLASNLDEFTDYLYKLSTEKKLRERLGKEAKRLAEKFSWKRTAQEYLEVFRGVLEKNN